MIRETDHISFCGTIISTADLGKYYKEFAFASFNHSIVLNACREVLSVYRRSLNDTSNDLSVTEVNHINAQYGTHIDIRYREPVLKLVDKATIRIHINNELEFSGYLKSKDVVFGSLGHELGHYYVDSMLNCDLMWNELLADFSAGLFFGLDKDEDPYTHDLDITTQLQWAPTYSEKKLKGKLCTTDKGYQFYREKLDGVHPMTVSRIEALRLGYIRGEQIRTVLKKEPTVMFRLIDLYEEFAANFYKDHLSLIPDEVLSDLADYNYDNKGAIEEVYRRGGKIINIRNVEDVKKIITPSQPVFTRKYSINAYGKIFPGLNYPIGQNYHIVLL